MRTRWSLFLATVALASVAAAQPPCPADVVAATASGDTISVRHGQAERNCCTDLTLTVQTQDFVVDFLEGETGLICRCICCFDMRYAASGFAPGRWVVRVWDETGSVLYGEDTVDVVGPGGMATLGAVERGDCTVSTGPETWSAIRKLYR